MEILQYAVDGLVIGSIYALTAIGFSIIFSLANRVNLAHGEFYVMGSYLAFYLVTAGVPYLVSMLVAILTLALIGAAVYFGLLQRLKGDKILNSMLVSIGLSIFIQNLILALLGPTSRRIPYTAKPIILGPFALTDQKIIIVGLSVILVLGLTFWLRHSWLGQAMRATADDPDTAMMMGIKQERVMMLAFVIGSAMAAISGTLLGAVFPIGPASGFGPALKAFIVTIFGGVGSIPGALIGAYVLGLGETYSTAYISSAYTDMVSFILLIVILLWRPGGILGKERS